MQSTTTYNSAMEANRLLANKLISDNADENVKQICSKEDFVRDPTAYLVNQMIKRGAGSCRKDDRARAYIINQIPGFYDKVTSLEYLRSFAIAYYKDHANKDIIMTVFENSIKSTDFQQALKNASKWLSEESKADTSAYIYVEDEIRKPLTVFSQAMSLQLYKYPEYADQE